MARQFIYHMQGLTKKFGNKTVLDNIHLSFYPDAKIGMVGVNGSGKSTLLENHGGAWMMMLAANIGLRTAPRSVIWRRNRVLTKVKTFGVM